jgi:hypothetical protein
MSTVTGTFPFPTTRQSGAALALTDINYASLTLDGVEIQQLKPTDAVVNWTDTTAGVGSHVYEVKVVTNDGLVGAPSNDVSIVVAPPADPASAGVLTASVVA